jgi:hypothetical protein
MGDGLLEAFTASEGVEHDGAGRAARRRMAF